MDPNWKIVGSTILAKIQNGRHSKTEIIISWQQMAKFYDVNINFLYIVDEESFCNDLKVIGI